VVEKSQKSDGRQKNLAEDATSCGEGPFTTLLNIFHPNHLHTSQTARPAAGELDRAATPI
jgi:hypothetical protein